VKLFLTISRLCDHNTSTSQTDGRTNRRTDDLPQQYCALRNSCGNTRSQAVARIADCTASQQNYQTVAK